MTAALTPLKGKRITWTTLIGLLLVPLTIAGLFIWGLWNPTERLENVTAAVVNLDEPVTLDGQIVPLGRVLAAELIAGSDTDDDSDDARQNFTWVLTNEEDSRAGLADGRYATSITIPKNFSAASTSLSGGPSEARAAKISITESDQGRLLDSALSGIVTQTATRVLNQQLGEQFVGSVFVGMASLHDGISEAADGAHKLADGGKQLADGMSTFATGVGQLSAGTQSLASGAQAFASGVGQTAAGAQEAANGGKIIADSTAEYVNGVNSIVGGLQGGLSQAIDPLNQVREMIADGTIELPEGITADELLQMIDPLIAQIDIIAVDGPDNPLTQMKQGGSALAGGAAQSAAGQQELANGLVGLAGGASELSNGISQLAGQTPELVAGATGLADGAAASASGALALAEGLDTAAAGIPNYNEGERQIMASTAIEGVKSEGASDELFNASGVPLFAGIALWAGALASFLVLSPLWSRTRTAARGVLAITARSALPAVLLGAAQGTLAGIVLPLMLGYDFVQGLGFFGFAVFAGVAFGLVVQGLSARLGGVGRFVAFALLVVAFVVGIVSTVPGALAVIGDASPIGAAFAGFQAIAAGVSGTGGAAALLFAWGLGGLALTAWAVARARRPDVVPGA